MSGHSTRARAALARIPEVDPAIAALALWCQHRDGQGATTTRGEVISYGAAFPLLPIEQQTGVLAHHVMHVALRHSARRAALAERLGQGFEADLHALACDALVNEALLRAGHALPRPVVRAGDLVALLPEDERPEDVLAEWDSDRLYFALTATQGPGGRSAGEAARAYARQQGFEDDLSGVPSDDTPPEIWAGRVSQALQQGAGAGGGIGAVLARFADLPRGTIPWELQLRRLMTKAVADFPRLSHKRPARAWLAREALARTGGGPIPVFEPGQMRDGKRPRLVVALDTSSSITDTALRLFAPEALSVARRTGAETDLLAFDTEVHTRARLDRASLLTGLTLRRDGGTDFAAVLQEAQARDPSMIVMLTDLDAPVSMAPKAPVVWVVPHAPPTPPPFGTLVPMDAP